MAITDETEVARRLAPAAGAVLDARSAAARVGVGVGTLRAVTATGEVVPVRLRARGGPRGTVRRSAREGAARGRHSL